MWPLLFLIPLVGVAALAALRIYGKNLSQASGADRSIAVPIDDFVTGSLPPVCAKTGRKASGYVDTRTATEGGPSLLLVLLGPLGIVAYILLEIFGRESQSDGLVPLSRGALHESNGRGRENLASLAVLIGVAVSAIVGLAIAGISWFTALAFGVLVTGAAVVWVGANVRATIYQVRARLDGSKRWVHLDGVHPLFVEAVRRDGALAGKI